MTYKYKHFIPENTAPKGAKNIAVFNNDKKVYSIPLGRLTPTKKEKLYSFGLLSDIHVDPNDSKPQTKLDNAMTFFKEHGCSFLCHCGDISMTGLWYPISETEHTSYYSPTQFDIFYSICNKHNMPVYGSCGNHESYNGYDIAKTYTDIYGTDPTLVVNNLEKLQEYSGNGLVFTMTQGDDVFIFVGQSTQQLPMTIEHLQWLYETLEENRNKRCFVFNHSFVSKDDSGNPMGFHSLPLFEFWGSTNTKAFNDMMAHYKNTMFFHGHSHVHFSTQEQVSHAIYSTNLGYRSVHVPSSANGRRILKDEATGVYKFESKNPAFSLGYMVEVYDDCIVLNGIDFINNEPVPIGTYEIDTTLVEIEEKTFIDSTGTIKT